MAKKTTPKPEATEDEAQTPNEAVEEPSEETAAPSEAAAEAPEEAADEAAPGGAPEADERVAALAAEVADLKDKLLRSLAETENIRRRAARERQDASKYAISNFARELLSVADNLRRALTAVDAEARGADAVLESLCTGVEMTEKAMLDAFERVGILRIEAQGQRFDHNLHEALFEIEDPSQPAGTVLQVIEEGYLLHDRLLRPSKVGVSRGGPKEVSAPAEAEADAAGKGSATAYEKKAGPGAQFDQET